MKNSRQLRPTWRNCDTYMAIVLRNRIPASLPSPSASLTSSRAFLVSHDKALWISTKSYKSGRLRHLTQEPEEPQ